MERHGFQNGVLQRIAPPDKSENQLNFTVSFRENHVLQKSRGDVQLFVTPIICQTVLYVGLRRARKLEGAEK